MNRRHFFVSLCLSLFLVSLPLAAQEEAKLPIPAPSSIPFVEEGSWTLAVIPDTQNYVKRSEYQGILELMTAWISKNAESEHIRAVLQVGDLTDRNDISSVSIVKNTDQLSPQQWEAVSHSMKRLSNVPTVIVPGNHDYGTGAETAWNRESHLSAYFPADWNPANAGHLVSLGKNFFGDETLENAAYEFPFTDGRKLLVIALEFAPSDRAIEWAKEVVSRETYKNAFVVIVTHSYIGSQGKRVESEKYKMEDANYGEQLWQKLIFPSDNIRMVVCGHIGRKTLEGSAACSFDLNHNGERVWQLLFDAQFMGEGNGGDGWIQLLRFSGDGKKVRVQTFSPLLNISTVTRDAAWEKSPLGEYEFEL